MDRARLPRCPGGNLRKSLFTQFKIAGLCRDLGADLLHSLQFLVPLNCPCPAVATVHDLAWLDFPETIDRLRRTFYRLVVPRSLERAAAVITNSEATSADVRRHFPQLAGKITTAPHGTPSWALRCAREDTGPHPAPERPFFLFVGTLEPRKNLSRLLEAYGLFLDAAVAEGWAPATIPDLVLVGARGWNLSALNTDIAEFQRRGRLRVCGYVPAEKLWRLYRTARALTFPSLGEGFGLPLLEAMAAGLPVMTSRRGGMAEVAGAAARYVDPLDPADMARALRDLAADDDLCADLVNRGRDRLAVWDWARTADRTVEIYRRVLGGGVAK